MHIMYESEETTAHLQSKYYHLVYMKQSATKFQSSQPSYQNRLLVMQIFSGFETQHFKLSKYSFKMIYNTHIYFAEHYSFNDIYVN